MLRRLAWLGFSVGIVLAAMPLGAPLGAEEPEFDAAALEYFEKQVRPLLVARCFECHSAKSDKPKGGLRLDSRSAALRGGDTGPALVAGKPKESLLIDAINYGDLYQMPPKNKLAEKEIAVLTRWVQMGAPWPAGEAATGPRSEFNLQERKASHWAWQPIADPPLPAVRDDAWPSDPLDRFVLARLEQAGLQPAAAADKATLLRRVYFDLIGLPPSAEQLDAFIRDDAPDAYARVVDSLLDSEHFGERWARHWLDLVRYAETYGHEFDYPLPNASAYRDYLIRAFNADVPYDQFVIEHLAGDLLPEPRRHPEQGFNESIIATGFWWLGEATHAPVDVRGDEAGRIDNQIDVMSKSFLGITVACARCHDHKFDAISTKDYYALAGFLQSSRRQEAFLDPHQRIAGDAERLEKLRQQAATSIRKALPQVGAASALARLLTATRLLPKDATAAQVAEVANGQKLSAEQLQRCWDALHQDEVKKPDHPLHPWWKLVIEPVEVKAEPFAQYARQLQGERERAEKSLEGSELFADFSQGFGDWRTTGVAFGGQPTQPNEWDSITRGRRLLPEGWAHSGRQSSKLQGVLRSPTFTLRQPHIDYRLQAQGVRLRVILDGYFMDVYNGLLFGGFTVNNVDTKGQTVWHRQSGDLRRYVGHKAYIEIIDQGDGFAAVEQIRFASGGAPVEQVNPLATELFSQKQPIDSAESLAAAYGQRLQREQDASQKQQLLGWMLEQDLLLATDSAALDQELAEVAKQMDELHAALPRPQHVLGMTDGTPENEFVHIRGNHRTLGEEVPRRLLEALPHDEVGKATSGRLQLAREIVDPANPLTSRVIVNRVWHHLFGRGIVATTDNLGVLGQRPTHPELLDHLARRLVREGWSLKRFIRSVVLSQTYRMSSAQDPRAEQADPKNVLLHRAPIRRLQGEAIRDAILAVSGRLDRKLLGPPVPVHITPFMQGRGRPGQSGPLDGQGRRSIYIAVRRNFLSPMMLAYDAPIPFSSVGRRNVSNVPAQALILMNDPFVIEQARVWAERLLQDKKQTREARIDQLYVEALGRPPSDDERAAAVAFLATQAQARELTPDSAAHNLEVWSDLCHVIFNVKEFVYLH